MVGGGQELKREAIVKKGREGEFFFQKGRKEGERRKLHVDTEAGGVVGGMMRIGTRCDPFFCRKVVGIL